MTFNWNFRLQTSFCDFKLNYLFRIKEEGENILAEMYYLEGLCVIFKDIRKYRALVALLRKEGSDLEIKCLSFLKLSLSLTKL